MSTVLKGRKTRRSFLAATCAVLSGVTGRSDFAQTATFAGAGKPIKWVVFYGVTAEEARLASYDIVVLDPAFDGSISLIAGPFNRVCGYLSLGEIRMSDPLLRFLDPAALLPENPDWPGTRRVDVRHPSWRSLVLDRRIPSLLSRGFTGLMLDTLDTPPYLELLDPARFHGMREAAVALVDSVRSRWSEMMLIMNRGFALLPDVVHDIDAIIAESLLTSFNRQTGGFARVSPDEVHLQLDLLNPAVRRHPSLPILSLDYWDSRDATTIAEIYRRERELGHHPYVATPLLNQIVAEQG